MGNEAKDNYQLFDEIPSTPKAESSRRPLADKLRPGSWEEFVGIEALDSALISQLKKGVGRCPSLILWGPPGSGKTTLAKIIGKSFKADFVEISAVLGGVKEIREIVENAKRRAGSQTILFVDEIHRFNKAQLDAFLPHVEDGTIVLIGATTENPSFYLTPPLLSRTRVVVLPSIENKALLKILDRALSELNFKFHEDARDIAVRFVAGDARRLINLVESIAQANPDLREFSGEDLKKHLSSFQTLFYDRDGEEHYNMASAFIKSMRGSDPNAALYWGLRMIESGEDPRFIIRRMIIFASEDIGNADPQALSLAVATFEAFERIGLPEGKIPISQCITYLASAPKSNRSYVGMKKAIEAVRLHPKIPVPLHLRNAPTKLMKDLNYGKDYQYPHDAPGGKVNAQYLPDELKGAVFYETEKK